MRFLLLLALLAAAAVVGYRCQQQQSRLEIQLQQLDYALNLANNRQAGEAVGTLKLIEAEVAKNRNTPTDRQVLRRANVLHTCVIALLDTLRANRIRLRRATGNAATPALLRHSGVTDPVARLLGRGTRQQQLLSCQVASCADTLRQLGFPSPFQLPDFTDMPVLDALSSFTQLESDLLTVQASALQQLTRTLETCQLSTRPAAIALAEANVVAPGDTYRARLLLIESIAGLPTQMSYNGRLIPVGPTGIGLVRFRAPTRPGPATWTGTIRLDYNGRDSTFKVTVPYRVARR